MDYINNTIAGCTSTLVDRSRKMSVLSDGRLVLLGELVHSTITGFCPSKSGTLLDATAVQHLLETRENRACSATRLFRALLRSALALSHPVLNRQTTPSVGSRLYHRRVYICGIRHKQQQ